MRLFLFAVALVLAVLGCSDGKLNLLLVFWGEHEELSSASVEPKPSSSSIVVPKPSSSSEYVPSSSSLSSSSEEEIIPSSSSEEIPSSSSSSRGARSSAAKTDSNGNTYEDYPTLEIGAAGVKKGVTTRYWDGCKPHCSWPENIGNPNPWAIAKACDKNGYNEIPLLFLDKRSNVWGTYYNRTPSAWDNTTKEATDWVESVTYENWIEANPNFAKKSLAYTCFDLAPYAVNDTLAYAFAATHGATLPCGKCARLQFNGTWSYDKRDDQHTGEQVSKSRVTHLALKSKTLIVMANNTGTVGENHFDIMIPGGGVGAVNCFTEQIGLTPKENPSNILGHQYGGLLSECSYNEAPEFSGTPSDRFQLKDWQKCLETRCHRAFDRVKNEAPHLLAGCLWHVEWFMAADNPDVEWIETPCPKYLVDKYNSTATTKLPDCYTSNPRTCQIDGMHN